MDTLQKLCLESGALGSRQTGGGWGGAVISLVPVSSLDEFMSSIKGKFSAYEGLSDEAMGKAVFATAPGCGAGGECLCQGPGSEVLMVQFWR